MSFSGGSGGAGGVSGTGASQDHATLPAGTIINGNYKVIASLGSGGMSQVYRCQDLKLNRFVAVKLLHPGSNFNQQAILRFQREGRAVALLAHPGIVQVYGLEITEQSQPLLVLEVVQGQSLAHLLATAGYLPVYRTLKIVRQICDALQHAHTHGVVHRDLKPSNVMLVDAGKPNESAKILDFGIAKIVADNSIKATQTGEVFGSPAYMSPEQCLGKAVDPRSDQYSLACMIFELLTGRPPFVAEASLPVIMSHVQEPPPRASQVTRQAIPPHVEQALAKMLSKNPDHRFATISDACQALLGTNAIKYSGKPSGGRRLLITGSIIFVMVIAGSFSVWNLNKTKSVSTPMKHAIEDSVQKDSGAEDVLSESLFDSNIRRAFQQLKKGTVADSFERPFRIPESATNSQLDYFAKFPASTSKIRHLSFRGCYAITDDGLKCLTAMPHLVSLDLDGIDITNKSMQWITSLNSLQSLNLCKNPKIDDDGISQLRGLHLQNLYLSGAGVSGTCFKEPGNLRNLHQINLERTRARVNISALRNLNVTILYFGDAHLEDSDLDTIKKMRNITVLCLDKNHFSTAGVLTLNELPFLHVLTINDCGIDAAGKKKIAQTFSNRPNFVLQVN